MKPCNRIEFLGMEEIFIQFLWRHQHPLVKKLKTVSGHSVLVHFPGVWNNGPGPDFLNAKVEWNGLKWSGHIEFHIHSKDWMNHGHHLDAAYNQVILHVVMQGEIIENAGVEMVLLPKSEIEMLYQHWKSWRNEVKNLPCAKFHHEVREIVWFNWLTRMGVERLEQRCTEFQMSLGNTNFKWSGLLFQKWFRSYGKGKVGDTLEQIAYELNAVEFLHLENQFQKALLFEICGYSNLISAELKRWAKRYCTLRGITQRSELRVKNRFGRTFNNEIVAFILSLKHFWNVLNNLREPHNSQINPEIPTFVYINAIAPVQFFMGWQNENELLMNNAVELLEKLSPERNARVQLFQTRKGLIKNAFQSQATIHLFSVYCSRNKCLSCSIGTEILIKNENFPISQRCS